MSRSILIELAYDSIKEVLQAQNIIHREKMLQKYPLLQESIPLKLNIYVNHELFSSYESKNKNSLLEEIIFGAKKAAFKDKTAHPLKIREFLQSEIEIILQTPQGVLSHRA